MHATGIVRKAIEETSEKYWNDLCESRSFFSEKRRGSYFRFKPDGIDKLIKELEWEVYDHENIVAPARGFIARHVFGYTNVIPIVEVPKGATVLFEDPKDTGFVECTWKTDSVTGHRVEFVTLIIGPVDGKDRVWTFFPGYPIEPSRVERRSDGRDLHGENVAREVAQAMGVKWVKIATPSGTKVADGGAEQQKNPPVTA